MIDSLKRLLKSAQITRATGYGVINVGWRFVSGPVSSLLILLYFTPEVQGFYYTFSSLLALQVFVELGFSNIITYFASHEWASLYLDSKGNIEGEPDALSRLVSLGRAAAQWYFVGGAVITVALEFGGYYYFSQSANAGIRWQYPWITLCLLSGITFMLTPVWALLEGCNQVASTYFFRMITAIFTSLVLWVALYLGAGLWAAPVMSAFVIACSLVFLIHQYKRFFFPFIFPKPGPRISWWSEIWQVQWRTALSYLSGYFTGQVFTPVMFHFHGPVLAGQFGMTWNIAYTLAIIGGMWSSPRGPQFAMMIARKEYKALDQLLSRIMITSLTVMLLGALSVWVMVYGLNVIHHRFAPRLLSPLSTAILLAGVIIANALTPMATYVRAHKREPYVGISILLGVVIGTSVFLLGSRFGDLGIGAAYLIPNLLIAFPGGLFIFMRCRQQWHK